MRAEVQQRLARWNQARLEPRLPDYDWRYSLDKDQAMLELEGSFLDLLRAEVQGAAARAPTQADAFVAWFEALELEGAGQHDPLFAWLAESASLTEMRWYLAQEAAGEAGFEDLTAYTQVKLAPLIAELKRLCADVGAFLETNEIEPDVFGEELEQPHYERVERIAAIGAVLRAPER